ncbi:MAG: hypothetical protein HUJ54_02995 [Erysipelotrichaceae bacterium]|nr:hypothetical protein [Erysipelotrichaceae bacterium]
MKISNQILYILGALLYFAAAALVVCLPEIGIFLAVILMVGSVFVTSIRYIGYYLTAACHMVGGVQMLFMGIFFFDLGLFFLFMESSINTICIIYIVVSYCLDGGIDVYNALETKSFGLGSWKRKCAWGAVKILYGVLCLLYMQYPYMLGLMVAVALVGQGVDKLIKAFRKPEVFSIQ